MARSMKRTMRGMFRALRPHRAVLRAMPGLLLRLMAGSADAERHRTADTSRTRSPRHSLRGIQHRIERAQGKFIEGSYRNRFGTRRYKLFVPADDERSSLPMVVMLHGCTQTPDDFALATGMNALAALHRMIVLYPAQSTAANRSRCWNWFRAADQQRASGEPAILAGLTRQVIKAYGVDARRVYAAGLSAGAAMAVILGRTYPDLYAAIGVHSGLPYRAAHDESSAFAAMRGETIELQQPASCDRPVPTISIHGDRDRIVHPRNAERLLDQFLERCDGSTVSALHERIEGREGRRSCSRAVVRNADGIAIFEHWSVHGGGHAWFGGTPRARHADPAGPDASLEMLRFFQAHRLNLPAVGPTNVRTVT